jgi:dihydroorotate dehydrogenase
VGLAAGFDKDGRYIKSMAALGFGFMETGTVTPMPQPGNERPRLFRLPADKALINRMGFNNQGVDVMAARLRVADKEGILIGGNIGKNKTTPNENAIQDYETCFEKLFDHVDYFVVNVSSPNTPGLRSLQEKEPLTKLLNHLQALNHRHESPKPLLLKIAPDLSNTQLDDIVSIVIETRIAGVVATNTTILREGLKTSRDTFEKIGAGGLSGIPLQQRSTEIIRYLHLKAGGKFIIIVPVEFILLKMPLKSWKQVLTSSRSIPA